MFAPLSLLLFLLYVNSILFLVQVLYCLFFQAPFRPSHFLGQHTPSYLIFHPSSTLLLSILHTFLLLLWIMVHYVSHQPLVELVRNPLVSLFHLDNPLAMYELKLTTFSFLSTNSTISFHFTKNSCQLIIICKMLSISLDKSSYDVKRNGHIDLPSNLTFYIYSLSNESNVSVTNEKRSPFTMKHWFFIILMTCKGAWIIDAFDIRDKAPMNHKSLLH